MLKVVKTRDASNHSTAAASWKITAKLVVMETRGRGGVWDGSCIYIEWREKKAL